MVQEENMRFHYKLVDLRHPESDDVADCNFRQFFLIVGADTLHN